MQALVDYLVRAESRGEFRLLLIGGRALEAHGVVRFTKDVDFLIASTDTAALTQQLQRVGYSKVAQTSIFSRWVHPAIASDDVDVMYVSPDTFEKLLIDSVQLKLGAVAIRVPSLPSLIALKLHAMRNDPERLDKDGRDIAELLRRNPGIIDRQSLEALFTKYDSAALLPQFSHLTA